VDNVIKFERWCSAGHVESYPTMIDMYNLYVVLKRRLFHLHIRGVKETLVPPTYTWC